MRAINALFLFTMIFTIPAILTKALTLVWSLLLFLYAKNMLIDAEFQDKHYKSVRIIKAKHLIAIFLILLSFCFSLSFCIGYFERINAKKVFSKLGKNEILMRSYNQFTIYYRTIKRGNGIENNLILIEYSPNVIDTLVQIENKELYIE
jgi:hypothetical protein